jgi:peptidoglycan/LPS O-acetylase OafA/YrhL
MTSVYLVNAVLWIACLAGAYALVPQLAKPWRRPIAFFVVWFGVVAIFVYVSEDFGRLLASPAVFALILASSHGVWQHRRATPPARANGT